MDIKEILKSINNELESCMESLDEGQLQELKLRIREAKSIFVAGAGRSLLMIRGFAMRLMHLGFSVYVVGETTTPAIGPGDLLIIASGSGSTGSLTVMAEKCKKAGADLALITTIPDSVIGRKADCIVHIDAPTTKNVAGVSHKKTVQLGANTFEQSVLLVGDAIVIDISSEHSLEKSNELLMKKHANLE
ncbi:MAG: 6-phospho-3-hexuloisomerase [Eubacteriales bacterium]|nr:6-phospho-3-hexuloisomerase [Eubacteriales bacterium]